MDIWSKVVHIKTVHVIISQQAHNVILTMKQRRDNVSALFQCCHGVNFSGMTMNQEAYN